jgi:pyrimidine and pyridine-specific 5'-nucleotidase
MYDAGVTDPKQCYFVDDSAINCEAAVKFGWENVVHKLEPEDPKPEPPVCKHHVRNLQELRKLFPDIFLRTD